MMPGVSIPRSSFKAKHVRAKAHNVSSQQTKVGKPTAASRTRSPQPSNKPTSYEGQMFSVSHPELPTTIPDSVRTRIMSLGSGKSGDTQPLSQSIYEGLELAFKGPAGSNGSMLQKSSTVPFSGDHVQTGQVDLIGIFEQPSAPGAIAEADREGQNDEDIYGVSQIDVRAELYPEFKRFQIPKTPATSGKKRNHRGEVIYGGVDTPSLPVNPFANHTEANIGVMGLSQVFKATQAPSSPFIGRLPSDITSDRPSPDMHSVQRPSTALPLSSPARLQRQGLYRSVTEPHDNYVSRQESQAEREKRLRLQPTSSPLEIGKHFQDSSDDDFGPEQSQLLRRMNKRRIELEASHQFDTVRAKPRPGSSGARRALDKGNLHQEDSIRAREIKNLTDHAVLISDDLQLDELVTHDSEDETEREENLGTPETELPDELGEEDKENMEARRFQVLMTTSRTPQKTYINVSSQSSPLRLRLKSFSGQDEIDELAADDVHCEASPIGKAAPAATNVQTVAVADSQTSPSVSKSKPEAVAAKHNPTEPILPTEIGTFVPQSQVNSVLHTSQIDSSIAGHLNGSSIPSDTLVTPSGTRSSPRIIQNSSPFKQVSPRRSVLRSGSPKFVNGRIGSSQLASSPPRIPSTEGKIPSLEHSFSKSPSTEKVISNVDGGESHGIAEAKVLLDNLNQRSFPALQSEIRSEIEHDPTKPCGKGTLRSTIPETSSVTRNMVVLSASPSIRQVDNMETSVSTNAPANLPGGARNQQPSGPSTIFETAQTHLSSACSHMLAHRRSSDSVRSPQKFSNLKTKSFADIAADPSPPDDTGMDDIYIGPMTTEDFEFQALMEASSPIPPTRKRRKGISERANYAKGKNQSQTPSVQTSSSPRMTRSLDVRLAADVSPTAAPILAAKLAEPVDRPGEPFHAGFITNVPVKVPANYIAEIAKNPQKSTVARLLKKKSNLKLPKTVKETTTDMPKSRANETLDESTNDVTPGQRREFVIAPNRVLAMFKGSSAAYYPATCIGIAGVNHSKYRVRFDDGTVDIVNASLVKRLELHKGDMVKLDISGHRSHTYVVVGLLDKQEPFDPVFTSPASSRRATQSKKLAFPTTDIYGHSNVMLSVKQRHSVSGLPSSDIMQTVPLTKIYLPSTLWTSLKDRLFLYHPLLSSSKSGLQTPSDRPSTPSTPSSKTRRLKASVRSYSTTSVPTSTTRKTSSLFNNMVFGLTNIVDGDTRQQIIQQIHSNGGYLLEDGFDELFNVPSTTPDSPLDDVDPTMPTPFHLKPTYFKRGFTCLVTDRHCRNQKFFQALALGIPCLATRWVRDCITRQELLPWEPYLLPSGDSTFLNAVRARLLPSYATPSAELCTIISHRPTFLAGSSVLLITGKGKEEQMMRAYPFIAYALGATKVSRASSLDTARQMVADAARSGEEWNWVCYHEGEKSSEGVGRRQVEAILFGSGERGRKRKQSGGPESRRGRTRVVATEFVIQSLVLGQLLDED